MEKKEERNINMKKSFKILKVILPLVVSIFALIISFLALSEARLANRLKIEPVISIQYPDSFKGYKIKIILKNEGNVGIKNLVIAYVIERWESSEEDLRVLVISPTYRIPGQIKVNEERLFPINLEGEIDFAKTETDKIPDGRDLYVEIGHGIFLGVKVLYRRVSDSKLFEKASYFYLMPKTSEIIVTELKGWFAEPFLDIIKKIEGSFPF